MRSFRRDFVAALVACALATLSAHSQWDPEELQKLLASDGHAGARFGRSAAVSGDALIIGAILGQGHGAAYIFRRQDGAYFQEARLLPPGGGINGEWFGVDVDIDGDTAIVGKLGTQAHGGSATIFARQAGVWTVQAELTGVAGFGGAVAIRGDTALVGSSGDDTYGTGAGAAYVFTRNGTTWTQTASLVPADLDESTGLGSDVALSDDRALIGAEGDDETAGSAGAAYVFSRSGGTWTEESKLLALDGEYLDHFGGRVALDGDVVIIGANGDDNFGRSSGSAYVFRFDGEGWVEEQKLVPADGVEYAEFGRSVAINGDLVLVGAPSDTEFGDQSGAAYLLAHEDEEWVWIEKLGASDAEVLDHFGQSVVLSDGMAIVGAPLESTQAQYSGAAYVFDLDGETGISATLIDFTVAFGSLVSGALQDLVESDNSSVRVRSRFGFVASEANVLDVRIGAVTAVEIPASFDISVEGRISQAGGTSKLRLRNWDTNGFQQVHQYPIGAAEIVEVIENVSAANRVRQSDGRIELSIRQSVLVVFTAGGFDSFTDRVFISIP